MAFSFGTTATNMTKPPGFGPTTTTAGFGFGGLGGTTTTASTGFGFGGLGTTTTTSGTTGFGGFGAASASKPSTGTGFGGFGTNTSLGFGTGTTGFGSTASGTTGFGSTPSTFGTSTSTGLGTGLGGGLGTGLGTGLGSGLGTGLGTGTGFGAGTGFGTGIGTGTSGFGTTGTLGGTGTGFGLNLAQQQQHQQATPDQQAMVALANMATAVSLPLIFGDERDAIIAKWNQTQAFWGMGKGFYSVQGENVNFTPDNPFCRFKAVGYSCIPGSRNKDGLVAMIINCKHLQVKTQQTQIVDAMHKILGSKPNLAVCVESVKALPDDKTEFMLYIQERSASGTTRRLPASELFNFMNQPNIKNQLVQNLATENLVPKVGLTQDQLKHYLDNPPSGIDPLIWRQAKLDNPDPEKLIPVPMIGFSELHKRLKHQDQQTKLHQTRLDMIASDIAALQQNQTDMLSKIEQYKRKHLELGHRVLQVMVRQEVYRKLGYAIQADEEQLRVQLEATQSELNAPTQFKGRLNELMSQLRMQHQFSLARSDAAYQMDPSVQMEIRQHLKGQQQGLTHLINIIKDDLEDLRLIEQGLSEAVTSRR